MNKLTLILFAALLLTIAIACAGSEKPNARQSRLPEKPRVHIDVMPKTDFVAAISPKADEPADIRGNDDGVANSDSIDVSGFEMLEPDITGAGFDYDIPNIEELMVSGWHGAGASPTHIAIRGVPVDGSTRCTWRGSAMTNTQRQSAIRYMLGSEDATPIPSESDLRKIFDAYVEQMAPQYRDAMRRNLYHLIGGGVLDDVLILACFVDFYVDGYLLGSGSKKVTVGYEDIAKSRSYQAYRNAHAAGRYGIESLLSESAHAIQDQKTLADAESRFGKNIEGRQSVVFLTPMAAHHNITVESWQVIAQWDLQTVDGTVSAVRYGANANEAEHTQTFTNLKTRITKAAASDDFAGKRIANTSGLNKYYRDIGAYADITPNDGQNNPFTPEQPPLTIDCSNGVVVPSPVANPELVKECEILAAMHDAMDLSGQLDWHDGQQIGDWEGIVLTDETAERVWKIAAEDKELSGPLPSDLAKLTELRSLDLSGNQITGTVPSWLTQLKKIEVLNLGDNSLTGSVPSDISNATKLKTLNLRNNQLTGAVPTSLGTLAHLENLVLNDNQLTGTIPVELASISTLRNLRLSNNNLTGGVPSQLGNLSNLEDLILSENQLTGTIPTTLGNLTNLEYLWLNDNRLTGSIPTELGALPNLFDLVLGDNQLTGQIPSQLGNLSGLVYLDLGNNSLSGSIPGSLGNASKLETIRLFSNSLTGALPATLTQLTDLEELYLAGNRLTGCIPAALLRVAGNDLATLNLPTCPAS